MKEKHHSVKAESVGLLSSPLLSPMGSPGGSDGKSVCLQCRRPGFDPGVRKILWRRTWHPTPVLLPGKSHGWSSLVGYSPWGCKESDTTERLALHMRCVTERGSTQIQALFGDHLSRVRQTGDS